MGTETGTGNKTEQSRFISICRLVSALENHTCKQDNSEDK